MNRPLILLYSGILLLVVACSRETPSVLEVPEIVQPFIDDFEQEALERGITNLPLDNLIVEFRDNLESSSGDEAAGLCRYPTTNDPTPHIYLDTTSYNWQNNVYHREALVFHELGHCILNRVQHRDDMMSNGNMASIMLTVGEQLYGGSLNDFKRDYYLDELFNESVSEPDWARNTPAYESQQGAQRTEIFVDDFFSNGNLWALGNSPQTRSDISGGFFFFESKNAETAFFTSQEIELDQDKDYEIELLFEYTGGTNSFLIQWGGSGPEDFFFFGVSPDSSAFAGNWQTGLSIGTKVDSYIGGAPNKLTIRKVGEFYHVYINEEYFDIYEAQSLFGDLFAFYIGPESGVKIDYLYIHELG